jgi:hypothetical protein
MIYILNISERYSKVGEQRYSVRVNSTEITQFTHMAEDGLAICLKKASEAVILAENRRA